MASSHEPRSVGSQTNGRWISAMAVLPDYIRTNGNCWLSCIRNGVIISASSAPGARAGVKERVMKQATERAADPEMRAEYDFSRGVRGKYARRYAQGANVVVLEADVAKVFPNAKAVNDSLRALAGIMRRQHKALAGKGAQ